MALEHLPRHLRRINRVFMDAAVADSPMARRVLDRLKEVPAEVLDEPPEHGDIPSAMERGRDRKVGAGHVLYLKEYKGDFLRFCPGTRFYNCCGYRIVHIGENCPLTCSYCILQAYFQDRVLKVWANTDDLYDELGKAFGTDPNIRYRVGTGEFTDSLALEPVTGYAGELVEFLGAYPNVCLELKSKFIDLSWMDRVPRPDRVLPAWSMNAPEIVATQEHGASTLEERLEAARTCAEAGFRVCLHFDPIIHFPGWEQGYARTVEMIADYLRPEQVAYISLGSFRHMPELKDIILRNHPQAGYVYGEFIRGRDNKMRLIRPLRTAQFVSIAGNLVKAGFQDALYFCMESDEVWRAVLGHVPGGNTGLTDRLMDRAFKKT